MSSTIAGKLTTMPTTPGRIAKFDQSSNVTDSIITETTGGSIGIGTTGPSVKTQIEGTNDQGATLAIRRADNNKFTRLDSKDLSSPRGHNPATSWIHPGN